MAKAKGTSVVSTEWNGDILTISVLGIGSIMFDRMKASEENRAKAELHGWTQRICDKAAIPAPVRKAGTSDDEWAKILAGHKAAKHAAMREMAEFYETGTTDWKMDGGERDAGLILDALCELRPKMTREQVAAFLKSRTKEQMAVVRAIPELIDVMTRLRKEKVAQIDTSAALAGLDDMGE